MFDLISVFAFDASIANGAIGLGTLLAIAVILAAIEDGISRMGKASENLSQIELTESGDTVTSPMRTYRRLGRIGEGDLCDVHFAESDGRDYVLKTARLPGGEHLLAKEFSVLQTLQRESRGEVYSEYFPQPVEAFSSGGLPANVFTWRDGFYSAEQIRDRYHRGLDGRHLGWMFNRMLEGLGFVHKQGWIHGAVLPPHSLFHAEDHGLLLIDWIHAEKANTALKVVPERFKEWYPPECRQKLPATPSVDIYLAAKSLIYLAGGDPIADTFPKHVPQPIQRFLKSCLLESPRMRSQEAWKLRQEFGEILEAVYGPPAFHVLKMSHD